MTYRLEFLPAALGDLQEIVAYISRELGNPSAADRFITEVTEATDHLQAFPYMGTPYTPLRPLSNSYRRIVVQNYLLFYYVSEPERIVTVSRVIYARRDIHERLY